MKRNNEQRRIFTNCILICVLVFLLCAFFLLVYMNGANKGKRFYADLQKEVLTEVIRDKASTQTAKRTVDFEKLWETNPEVYAWIEIPGTVINYPVLQHAGEDDYYLEYTIDHEKTRPGAIYSEKSSAKDFSGFVHILYGHNMRNGTMFADLHKYENAEFLQENPYIYIYTPDKVYTYEVFAAVVHNDKHLMYEYDFTTEAGRQEYLDDILEESDERNQYRDSVEVTADHQLLVLSTCVSGESDKRYLVNAVLVEEE